MNLNFKKGVILLILSFFLLGTLPFAPHNPGRAEAKIIKKKVYRKIIKRKKAKGKRFIKRKKIVHKKLLKS